MKDETVDFWWLRTKDGYQFVQGVPFWSHKKSNDQPKLWLCEKGAIRHARLGYQPNAYKPLEETSLFITFAEIPINEPTTNQEIMSFAEKYGLLTNGEEICETRTKLSRQEAQYLRKIAGFKFSRAEFKRLTDDKFDLGDLKGYGDPVDLWINEIRKMSWAWSLWKAVQTEDLTSLRLQLRFTRRNNGRSETWNPPDSHVKHTALRFIQKEINEQMKGRVSPRLLFETDEDRLGRYFVPHDLIGALWLQFADAVGGNRTFRKCKYCRTNFEYGTGGKSQRADSVYCSYNCRNKIHWQRIARAKALHAKGANTRLIAKELDITEVTAKKWVRFRKKKLG